MFYVFYLFNLHLEDLKTGRYCYHTLESRKKLGLQFYQDFCKFNNLIQGKEQQSFRILQQSPEVLPKSFTILPKSENEMIETTRRGRDEQYIKEVYQSFVVLGQTTMSEVDSVEDILEDTGTASSKDTIRLSDDDLKEEKKILRRLQRLVPLHNPCGNRLDRNERWFPNK